MTRGANDKNRGSHRGGRRGNNEQQSGLQRQNTGPRDGNSTPQQGRRGGAGKGQNQNKQAENTSNGPAAANRNEMKRAEPPAAVPQEEHIPVNSFNADEIRAGMKMNSEVKLMMYKPEQKATPATRSGSPWASKRMVYYPRSQCTVSLTSLANVTSEGKDFFLELRKQVTALQQTGGTARGG